MKAMRESLRALLLGGALALLPVAFAACEDDVERELEDVGEELEDVGEEIGEELDGIDDELDDDYDPDDRR